MMDDQLRAVFVSNPTVHENGLASELTKTVTEVDVVEDIDGDGTSTILIRGAHPELHGVVALYKEKEFHWGDGTSYYLWALWNE